ncbi:MAG: OB-fold domain-containing protein [bacterium]
MPYKERLNAGIVASALGLQEHVRAADFTGGLKAGTTALLAALEGVAANGANRLLVCGSECRLGKPASQQEMIFGDAAAALMVGNQDVIAEFKGAYSTTYDFVDHYRGERAQFDRQWEDRWIRDLGYDHLVPETVGGLLNKYRLKITDFAKMIYPCHYPAAREKLNRVMGIPAQGEQGNLQAEIGESGAAQSLVMLVKALEDARPGDKILVVSFGSGCDALYFEATDQIEQRRPSSGISGSLAHKAALDNYTKYLVWRDILPAEAGARAEEDLWTRWSLLWRKRKAVLGLIGGKCRRCHTPQFPAQRVCVNPECGAIDEMEDYPFSHRRGRIASYTGDMLAASFNPPEMYGQIEFEEGGKYQFHFTDCDLGDLAVGLPVRMSFRKKYSDSKRGITGYFWKAVPEREVK